MYTTKLYIHNCHLNFLYREIKKEIMKGLEQFQSSLDSNCAAAQGTFWRYQYIKS